MRLVPQLFRGRKQQTDAKQAMVMVMLPAVEPFDAPAALAHLTAHWTDLPSMAGYETHDATTVASIPGGALGMLHLPLPIPAGELAGPAAVAWHWPDASTAVAAHRSHVIVHVGSSVLDTIELRLLLTKLAASVLAVGRGTGVYVGDAMLVRSAEDYQNDARTATREQLPILSWIGFNPLSDDAGFSAYTTGLAGFGVPELEVRGSARPAPEQLGVLADLANYELSSGRVLRDGDTFGETELDRTRVRYRPSAFIDGVTVAGIELP